MSPEIAVVLFRYGTVALLYAFLAVILVTVVKDIGSTGKPSPRRKEWGQLLVVETGKSDFVAGDLVLLEPMNFFGRSKSNSVLIPDESVSAKHALLTFREKQWWLEDLGSTNGTYLNGHPVLSPSVVASGDVIEIGRTLFRFENA